MSLKQVILLVLNQGPRSGYDITKDFDDAVGYFWHASHQQVYRELAQLLETNWVSWELQSQQGKPDKKIYTITALGREELKRWLLAKQKSPRPKDVFLVKLLDTQLISAEDLLTQLQQQYQQCAAELTALLAIEAQHYPAQTRAQMPLLEQRLYLALRKGILFSQTWQTWADEAIMQLKAEIDRSKNI